MILDICYNQNGEPRGYYLEGNRDRAMGILRFSHEFDVYFDLELRYSNAYSIDCGETNRYRTEEEFEANFPGVLAAVREARKTGQLKVRHYRWDGNRNVPYLLPYGKEPSTK